MRWQCPRCHRSMVDVHVATWPAQGARLGSRRSVWVDEPLRCAGGCPLSSAEVARVLMQAYDRVAWQLPLDLQPEAA